MAIILVVDIILIAIFFVSIRNFTLGYFLSLCWKICFPTVVRFQIGGFSISAIDVLCITLIFAYFVNKDRLNSKLPKLLSIFLWTCILSTFLLILCSSGVVPYSHQFFFFIKHYLFQECLYIYLGFIAFQNLNNDKYFSIFLTVACIAGIYGIFVYLTKHNYLVDAYNIIYAGHENKYSFFMEETRGALEGRTSGTLSHPLEWGQLWNLIVPLTYFYRKRISKYLCFSVLLIGLINILLCGSRTALVALFLFFGFAVLTLSVKKAVKVAFCSMAIGLAAFIYLGHNQQMKGILGYVQSAVFFWDDTYSQKAGIVGSNVDMRREQLNEAVRLMSLNPIGGIGLDYQYYSIDHNPNEILLGFESIVYKKLVEQGLAGLLIFYYVVWLYYKFYRKRCFDKESRFLCIGFFVSFMASAHMTGIQGSSWMFFLLLPLLPQQKLKI